MAPLDIEPLDRSLGGSLCWPLPWWLADPRHRPLYVSLRRSLRFPWEDKWHL